MSTGHADTVDEGAGALPPSGVFEALGLQDATEVELPAFDTAVPEAAFGTTGPAARRPRLLERVHTLDAMRHPNFRRLWVANVSLSGAAWLQDLVLGWLTFHQTGSPFLTALAVGLVTLPYLFAAPLGGLIADLWDRKKMIAAAGFCQAITASVLAALLIFDALQTWMIFAYILTVGAFWAISEPARAAVIPDVVPKRGLMNAFALNALAFNSTRLVIPAIGGLLMVWIGPGPTMLYGVALYLVASVTAMRLQLPRTESDRPKATDGLRRIVEAARYVASEPPLLLIMGLSALQLFIVMPFVHSLLPVYAADVFEMGPAGLGMLMSALGAGAAVGTIGLATIGDVAHKGRLLIIALTINLVAMAALSQSGGALHPVAAMLLVGGSTAAQFSIGGAIHPRPNAPGAARQGLGAEHDCARTVPLRRADRGRPCRGARRSDGHAAGRRRDGPGPGRAEPASGPALAARRGGLAGCGRTVVLSNAKDMGWGRPDLDHVSNSPPPQAPHPVLGDIRQTVPPLSAAC